MRTYHKSISTSIDRLWPPSTAKLDVHLLISFAGACQSVTQTAHKTAQISSNCSLIVHVIKTCAFPRMKNHWKTSYSKRGQQKLCLYDVPMTCSGRSKKYGRSICGSSQPDFSEKHQVFWCFLARTHWSHLVRLQLCHWNPLLVRLRCSCRCVTNILLKWQHIV